MEAVETFGELKALDAAGDPRRSSWWAQGSPDYVADLRLRAEHVPALVSLARRWEDQDWSAGDAAWAPVHAWRALGQLGAAEAVAPLLEMLGPLDADHDDWFFEEFPHVVALIGPAAVPALGRYLADPGHREYARVAAADGLCEIARRHPEAREEAGRILREELERCERNPPTLNGFLVSYLADLGAGEASHAIQQAYVAGRVDESVCGPWSRVGWEIDVLDEPPPEPVPFIELLDDVEPNGPYV
ncbi:MAG: hypothetical protein ACE5JG_06115, partial [Planctomycetota bacterium]